MLGVGQHAGCGKAGVSPLVLSLALEFTVALSCFLDPGTDIAFSFLVDFVLVPVVFYLIVLAARINISTLRSGGWVFDIQDGEDSHWYEFYQWLREFL